MFFKQMALAFASISMFLSKQRLAFGSFSVFLSMMTLGKIYQIRIKLTKLILRVPSTRLSGNESAS